MYRISKDFAFAAAHHLPQLPAGHKCRRPHGHNYLVRVVVAAAALDLEAMVLDYGRLEPFGRWVADTLDHRDLNDVMHGPTTAERLACYLWETVLTTVALPAECRVAVGVSETPKTWAWYEP